MMWQSKQLLERLISKAREKDANSIIGLKIDVGTMGNNMVLVSATGTAVKRRPSEIDLTEHA